jgi:hypothetical protein
MEPNTPPPQPDPDMQLQRELYYQIVHALSAALPPPLADTQEELDRRDRTAIGLVATLRPVNAEEVAIAAHFVSAHAHAMDCMAQMRKHAGEPAAVRLDAQARGAFREARGARSLLLRVQAARQKREKSHAASDQDAWMERIALSLLTEALDQAPAAPAAVPPAPEPVPATPPPAPEAASPVAQSPPIPAPAIAPPPPIPAPAVEQPQAEPPPAPALAEDDELPADLDAEADRYAIVYPRRAWLLRKQGRVPDDCDFGPPEPELVHAIVTGTSPALRALDGPTAMA